MKIFLQMFLALTLFSVMTCACAEFQAVMRTADDLMLDIATDLCLLSARGHPEIVPKGWDAKTFCSTPAVLKAFLDEIMRGMNALDCTKSERRLINNADDYRDGKRKIDSGDRTTTYALDSWATFIDPGWQSQFRFSSGQVFWRRASNREPRARGRDRGPAYSDRRLDK